MKVTAHVTRSDLVRLSLWASLRPKPNLIPVTALVVGYLIFFAIWQDPATPKDWAIVFVLALAGGLASLLAALVLILAWFYFYVSRVSGARGVQTYSITEHGFHVETPSAEATIKWFAIRSLHESKSYIFIRVTRYLYSLIPKRAFASEAEFEEFWSKANAYWKQAS